MNRTDRLLAILLELQRRRLTRAEDLAAQFETSVRTIYRDMQALSEAGVPVVGATGQGYTLVEGYFLPPLTFHADEAAALLLGSDFVQQHLDVHYSRHAESSRMKIEAVLPAGIRDEVEQMRSQIKLMRKNPVNANAAISDTMLLLRQAIAGERLACFRYVKGVNGSILAEESKREVEPLGLVLTGAGWMLVAHCRLREEMRHFRLDRIHELELTEQTFQRPPSFDIRKYQREDDRNLVVKVLFPLELAVRVRENGNFYLERMEEADQGLVVYLRVRQMEDVLVWILGWGSHARVLEPQQLAQRVQSEARSMLEAYSDTPIG